LIARSDPDDASEVVDSAKAQSTRSSVRDDLQRRWPFSSSYIFEPQSALPPASSAPSLAAMNMLVVVNFSARS
jgi:hypothetical protein